MATGRRRISRNSYSRPPGAAGRGLPVDIGGGPTVDPTENVKDLSEALSQRQDDLRELTNLLMDEKIKRMERELIHAANVGQLRADHAKELRQLDADRLDKIRQVDVLNASTAAERAGEAIKTLAAQTTSIAEASRAGVAATATNLENRLATLFGENNKRLSALELSFSEGRGKQAVVDPQLAELVSEMRAASRSRATDSGVVKGKDDSWKFFVAVIGLIATMLVIGGVIVTLVLFLNRAQPPIYSPAPAGVMLPSNPPTTPVPR